MIHKINQKNHSLGLHQKQVKSELGQRDTEWYQCRFKGLIAWLLVVHGTHQWLNLYGRMRP
jgi:hypothetical protein